MAKSYLKNTNVASQTTLTFTMEGVGSFHVDFLKVGRIVVANVSCTTTSNYSATQRVALGVIPVGYRPSYVSTDPSSGYSGNWVSSYFSRSESGEQGSGEINFRPDGTIGYGSNVDGVSGVVLLGTITYLTD